MRRRRVSTGDCTFAGGFSTAEACVRTGRKFVGIELDSRWFTDGVKRVRATLAELN